MRREPAAPAPSRAYDAILRLLFAGRVFEASPAIDAAVAELRPWEVAELRAAVEFHGGTLRKPPRVGALARFVWWLWIDVPLGRSAIFAALHASAFVVSLSGLRDRVFARLRLSLAAALVHYRYTDFVHGLLDAAVLSAFAPRREVVQGAYFLGLVGMFECLCGRFDVGLDDLDRAHARLCCANARANGAALTNAEVYDRFLSIATVRALYLSYAGRYDEANREYEAVLDCTRTIGRYALIEVFLHSVRMPLDVERLDAAALAAGAAALKRLLGDRFRERFGLRCAIASSLAATLLGNTEVARQQLAFGAELYSDDLSAVEAVRYHFLRALVHLEGAEVAGARIHARRASALASTLAGSRFHEADVLLLEVELRLRTRLREGNVALAPAEAAEIRRALKTVAKRVRGSAFFDARVQVLGLYCRYLRGDLDHLEDDVGKLAAVAGRVSKRLQRALNEIDPRGGEMCALAFVETDAKRRRDLSLLQRFARLVRADGAEQETAALLRFLVGADDCTVVVEHGVQGATSGIDLTPGAEKLELSVVGGDQRVRFVMLRPLVELCFDERVAEMVRLAAEVMRVAMDRRHLLHLQREVLLSRTMQLLVHDIRRPFGALEAVMRTILACRSPEEVVDSVETLLPEVQRASGMLSRLIDDVLVLSNDRAPLREEVCPEILLDECVREALCPSDARDVHVRYELAHTRSWSVEGTRVRRLLLNLLSNGVQALRGMGQMWITSRDAGDRIEMVIGNDGPSISDEDLPHIFEAFFTKGKPGGTGLGLALAHQVVTAHNGAIECRQRSGVGVEFVFSLPASAQALEERSLVELRMRLPSGRPVLEASAQEPTPAPATDAGSSADRSEHLREARKALGRLSYVGRPVDVLLVGDAVSLRKLDDWLTEMAPPSTLRIHRHSGSAAALALARERPPDLAVLPLRPGADGEHDLSQLSSLLRLGSLTLVCMMAPGAPDDLVQRAREAGAYSVLVTPAQPYDVREWLCAVEERLQPRSHRGRTRLPTVALIDDSRVHLADWRNALHDDAKLLFFYSPVEFWAEVNRDPDVLVRLDLVIVDYMFLDCDTDGITFARSLKSRRVDLPVCLSTSGCGFDGKLAGAIDVVLDKSALSWPSLVSRLPADLLRSRGADGGRTS